MKSKIQAFFVCMLQLRRPCNIAECVWSSICVKINIRCLVLWNSISLSNAFVFKSNRTRLVWLLWLSSIIWNECGHTSFWYSFWSGFLGCPSAFLNISGLFVWGRHNQMASGVLFNMDSGRLDPSAMASPHLARWHEVWHPSICKVSLQTWRTMQRQGKVSMGAKGTQYSERRSPRRIAPTLFTGWRAKGQKADLTSGHFSETVL